MHRFKVFLAGSTKSDAQWARDRIRILMSKIQNRTFGHDENIALYVHDFKDFKSQQYEYNKFIQEETDIFIAVVDSKYDTVDEHLNDIGKGTFTEFMLACESCKEKGKPEIILLYKTSKERKTPTKRWASHLDQIGKYAIAAPKFHEILRQLETEIIATIEKTIPSSAKPAACKYQVGDIYEKEGLKGVVFSVDKNGENGKILSIGSSTICTWSEFSRKKRLLNSPWRVADILELEEIFLHKENLQKINKTLKGIKEGACLEYDRYKDTIWSCTPKSPFRQKAARWSHNKQAFTSGDCEVSHQGIIRPVADVKF